MIAPTDACPNCGSRTLVYRTRRPALGFTVRYRKCVKGECAGRLVIESRTVEVSRRVRLPGSVTRLYPPFPESDPSADFPGTPVPSDV